MPATSTLGDIYEQLVEETGLGFVIPSYTGTTTTLTLTNSYLLSNATAGRLPINTPIIITSSTGLGEMTYVQNYVPGTGVITVNPAITTGSSRAVALFPDSGIDHPDRVTEAINRAVQNRVARWQLSPLTFVPDGDLRGTTVTDYWTATNGTPTYVTAQVFPAGGAADAFGMVNTTRVLQFVTSNGTNNLQSNTITAPPVTSSNGQQWYFCTAIRAASGTTGTASIQVRDITNSATITQTVIRGSQASTHTTSSRAFMICEGTFILPVTCDRFAFRLVGSATALTIQMGPLLAYPISARAFPLPNRIESDDFIGNFHYGVLRDSPSGYPQLTFSDPITTSGKTHTLQNHGDHRTVAFNYEPLNEYLGPLYFDELVSDASLSALTSTTTFPLDQVVRWARFELYKKLYLDEQRKRIRDNAGAPVPSVWRRQAQEALLAAENSDYEPAQLYVVGRR